MKKDWKYILYLSLAIGLFLLVKLSGPKQYNWYPTYEEKDKNPFGAFVLKELLPEIFPGKKIEVSNKTFYELKNSVEPDENVDHSHPSFPLRKSRRPGFAEARGERWYHFHRLSIVQRSTE